MEHDDGLLPLTLPRLFQQRRHAEVKHFPKAVRILSQQADVVIVLGSQNSSNSQRLRELGTEQGKRAYLIDGAHDIQSEWFQQDDRVLVTAGASAPESVVQATVDWLVENFDATVRVETVRKEEVYFPLPKTLRAFAKSKNL